MLRFDAIGLRYERSGVRGRTNATPEVLHDISFQLEPGAFRWLLGPSGAGKTSLLRLMYLAVRPTRGRLTLLGTDVTTAPRHALPPLRRRIGVVFQDFRLLPHLSAFDNVALPLRIAGRPEGQIRADVGELLRWVGLARHFDARPDALSGGEQQRVAIARAVITRPALLLADEPTGNLDDAQAERLMVLFKEMNRIGTTVIVATHNESLVSRHPARALHIAEGRLYAEDTVRVSARHTDDAWPGSTADMSIGDDPGQADWADPAHEPGVADWHAPSEAEWRDPAAADWQDPGEPASNNDTWHDPAYHGFADAPDGPAPGIPDPLPAQPDIPHPPGYQTTGPGVGQPGAYVRPDDGHDEPGYDPDPAFDPPYDDPGPVAPGYPGFPGHADYQPGTARFDAEQPEPYPSAHPSAVHPPVYPAPYDPEDHDPLDEHGFPDRAPPDPSSVVPGVQGSPDRLARGTMQGAESRAAAGQREPPGRYPLRHSGREYRP